MEQHASVGAGGTIGIVGLGNMGGRIARRIVAAGHDAIGFDADPRRIAEAGVRRGHSVAGLRATPTSSCCRCPTAPWSRRSCSATTGSSPTGTRGPGGRRPDTAAPGSTVRLHAALAERGIALIDAGISGGAAAAEAGTLTIMAGGIGRCPRSRPLGAGALQRQGVPRRRERRRAHGQAPQQLPQRHQPRRDRRGDGRGPQGRAGPRHGARRDQRRQRRQLRHAQPVPPASSTATTSRAGSPAG